MKVLIAGGGIGGITAALCCLHRGHDVTVIEKAPALSEIGAGIQIPPNAMKVFEALGIDNLIADKAFKPEYIEARMGVSGFGVFTIPLADAAVKRWGSPYYHIHRADYISALEQALSKYSDDIVMPGTEVKGYKQTGNSVQVQLVNGSWLDADVLIGADGIHSATRTTMLGAEHPHFTGNVAWRAVVPIDKLGRHVPAPSACLWLGAGRHCVTYRLRGGALANLVGVVERNDWTRESWNEQGSREEALADFEGWHPIVTGIIEQAKALYRWALFDRPPLPQWTDGNVALLGDAAHPTLPFLAQGAAMAVEDAWILSRCISVPGVSVRSALNQYQAARFERTSSVQNGSRANAKTFHRRSLPTKLATYGPMWLAGKIAPSIVHKRNDYLYGHDVTRGQ